MLRFALVGVACLVGGCSMVTSYNNSLLIDGGDPRQGVGSYHIPKHILVATVLKGSDGTRNLSLVRKAIADPYLPMNLGLDLAATSDDDFDVTYADGMIQRITASADDKTDEMILNFTKAILSLGRIGTAGSGDLVTTEATKLVQVAFDPFDEVERQRANYELTRYGFCVAFASDPQVPEPRGCNTGRRIAALAPVTRPKGLLKLGRYTDAPSPTGVPETGNGLFYRQPIEHKIQIFQRNSPHCYGWCLKWEGYKSFGNQGPLLKVNVNRTIFVRHETTIEFGNDGVPNQVHVKKPSEALAFSTLSLAVIEEVIAAPVKAISHNVSTLQEEKKLVEAKSNLLESQVAYVDKLNQRLKDGEPIPAGHDIGGNSRYDTRPYGIRRRLVGRRRTLSPHRRR